MIPHLPAEEKLKAVQFWNVVSERLQEIVNNSAADISAAAIHTQMDKKQTDFFSTKQLTTYNLSVTPLGTTMVSPHPIQLPQQVDCAGTHTKSFTLTTSMVPEVQVVPAQVPLTVQAADMTTQLALQHQKHQQKHQHHHRLQGQQLKQVHTSTTITSVLPVRRGRPSKQVMKIIEDSKPADAQSVETVNLPVTSAGRPSGSGSSQGAEDSLPDQLQTDLEQTPLVTETVEIDSTLPQVLHIPQVNTVVPPHIPVSSTTQNTAITTTVNVVSTAAVTMATDAMVDAGVEEEDEEEDEEEEEEENMNVVVVGGAGSSSEEEEEEEEGDGEQDKTYLDLGMASLEGIKVINGQTSDGTSISLEGGLEGAKDANIVHLMISADRGLQEETMCRKRRRKALQSRDEEEEFYECEYCPKTFRSESFLTTHRWVHTKPYLCSECKARFSTKGNLIVHRRRHTGEKPYACPSCEAKFSTKGNLKRHVKTHSGEKPWQCTQCGGRFTEKKSLKVHMRRHTGEKPYECQVCGKRFAQTGILQTHMAMHLDQKSHLCELCGKSFRQKSQLRLHMQRHEGLRKFQCTHCTAKFLTKGDLERHSRVHTGERPYVCELCGKTFTRQQSLNEHMNRHYGLKPYECKYCGKGFAEMSACYKHIKSHERVRGNAVAVVTAGTLPDGVSLPPQGALVEQDLQHDGTGQELVDATQLHLEGPDAEKFTVLVHTDQALDVGSEMVVQGAGTNAESELSPDSQQPITVADQIGDFAAMNLLASASSYQQNY